MNFFTKRRLKKTFGKYVSDEAVEKLLTEGPVFDRQLQTGRIEYVFVSARADDAQELAERLGLIADVGVEYGAGVDCLVGPMVVMVFGTLANSPVPLGGRTALVGCLRERFGADVKIVHGSAEGHFGIFGGKTRFASTFTFDGFETVLGRLTQLEFGEAKEAGTF